MNASGIRDVPKNDLGRLAVTSTFFWDHNHIIIFFGGSLNAPSQGWKKGRKRTEVMRGSN